MDSLKIGFLMSMEFLQALEVMFPPRPPDPRDPDREVWMKAGERRLVEVLKAKFDQAQQEGLPHV